MKTLAALQYLSTTTIHFAGLRNRMLILGIGRLAKDLCQVLMSKRGRVFNVVGFLDWNPDHVGGRLVNPGSIGTFQQLFEIVECLWRSYSPRGRAQAAGTRNSL